MDEVESLRLFLKDFFDPNIPYSHFLDEEYPGIFSAMRRHKRVVEALGVPVTVGSTTFTLKRPGAHEDHKYTIWSNDHVTWSSKK